MIKEERINDNYILSNRQRRIIEIAAKTAATSDCLHKHGAVLIGPGGTVVNLSCNKNEFCAFGTRFLKKGGNYSYGTKHSEIGACLNMPRQLTEGGIIYVVRTNHRGELKNSSPCSLCQAVARYCGIKKFIYSTNEGFGEMRL